DSTAPELADTLDYAIREANRTVFRKAKSSAPYKGMGATVAVLLVWDGQALIGHVGDCRVHHHHSGRLTQVTKDQTLVARMIELGKLTPEEAKNHPARNDVIQAVGKHREVTPAAYQVKLEPGDWLVVASDGLQAHVDAAALQAQVSQSAPSAAHL